MSILPEYFEEMYAASDDPWGFATRPYEAAKYRATLAALPRRRYRSALEIGCSIGVLTALLAGRVDCLLAIDVSARALARASARCHTLPNVRFARMRVPYDFPDETFDLILLSEVGYYLSRADLTRTRDQIVDHLGAGGHLLLVHWIPRIDDAPLTGDEVHDAFLAGVPDGLRHLTGCREQFYRLDLFELDCGT